MIFPYLAFRLNPIGEYYNNKYPKIDATYRRADKLGELQIDVRQFLNPNNHLLPSIISESDDEKALEGLSWVIDNITYTPDKTQHGLNEYWSYAYETMHARKGDCEDGAILLYDMLRHAGIPAWKLRLSAGFVKLGSNKVGHAYLTYFCNETDQWVILDWCYWPNPIPINLRKAYHDEKNYLKIWFSFNELYAWAKGLNEKDKEYDVGVSK